MAEDDEFQLIPADDVAVDPDADLEAAAASALAPPLGEDADPLEEEAPEPYGKSWLMDFERGRLVRRGGSPVEVRGLDALRMRIMAALHTGRYAHPVFSDDFGMDDIERDIGSVGIALDDLEERIRDALLALDRVGGVEDFEGNYDPGTGVLTISHFTVVTDSDERLTLDDLRVQVSGRSREGLTEDA